jgi:hypothetical protein
MRNIKKISLGAIFILLLAGLCVPNVQAQITPKPLDAPAVGVPWTPAELLEPSVLAAQIKDGTSPLIFNIGAVEDITGAKHVGAVNNAVNMEKFKQTLASLPKSTELVIYCGCCPFTKCPNIRPAYNELKKDGFTNIKVLNLPTNLKTNWIAKGYPFTAD